MIISWAHQIYVNTDPSDTETPLDIRDLSIHGIWYLLWSWEWSLYEYLGMTVLGHRDKKQLSILIAS